MWIYDERAREYVWVETTDPPVNHTQNPLIGVALLAVVLWLAWVFSGSPQIVIVGW